jgi:hypothetical protein
MEEAVVDGEKRRARVRWVVVVVVVVVVERKRRRRFSSVFTMLSVLYIPG